MTSPETGLRERKKLETRRMLRALATRLFAEKGFDAVTVAEIAEAGGVSQKTVFNYFPTKEDLVLDGRGEVEAELLRAVRERDPNTPLLEVIHRHTLNVVERLRALPPEQRDAFRTVIAGTPSVHARMRQLTQQTEDELTRLLAQQTGATPSDPKPRLVAEVIGVLTRIAYRFKGPKRETHAEHVAAVDAAFELLGKGLRDYGRVG